MKLITLAAALAVVVPTTLGLTINTPTGVTECEPTSVTWSGGSPPYYLSIIPAGQVSATPYETFPPQNGTSYTWNVDLQANLNINFALKDGTGAQQYSALITIQSGSSSCLSSSQASVTVSSGASPTSASGSSGSTTTATGSSGSGSSTSTSSSSSPSSTSTKSNGADRLSVSSAFGVAGIMGLVGAALF